MKLQIGIYKTNEIVNGRFACQLLAIFSLIVLILAHNYSHSLAYGSCDTSAPHTPLKNITIENVTQFQISTLIQTYLSGIDSCEKVADGCQITAPEKQRKNFRFKQDTLLKTKIRPMRLSGIKLFAHRFLPKNPHQSALITPHLSQPVFVHLLDFAI